MVFKVFQKNNCVQLDKILIGTVVGISFIALVIPTLMIVGFNQMTSLILIYMLPLTGAVTGFVIEYQHSKIKTIKKTEYEKQTKTKQDGFANLIGKWVVIHTKMGSVHKGMVRSCNENLLALDYVTRLDVPNSDVMDHLFIDKNDIKRIEANESDELAKENKF